MKKQEVIIGKYTLESLTNGMYSSPLDLYREYIQNAVDSIDDAITSNLMKPNKCCIDIIVDSKNRTIKINDNGTGIKSELAINRLIDIGNSQKDRLNSRGFRGIGRLAGLGYCEQLVFTTSYLGESLKTIVSFDAKKLGSILMEKESKLNSASEVLSRVINIKQVPEKTKSHFFSVELIGVNNSDKLLDELVVEDYLVQNAPLNFDQGFRWQGPIIQKMKSLGFSIPSYNIRLNNKWLFKAYSDQFISDRVKRNIDTIKDVDIVPFYRNGRLSSILWCAKTNYYGTIIDSSIKGIRIRQGNILIGDKFSCSHLFKEERFNGWLVGEVYVIDNGLIANARRDDFEKNDAYYSFVENFREWSASQTKEIRKISYERTLSSEKKAIIEADFFEEVNDILDESVELFDDFGESDFIDQAESESIAETDYIGKLSDLIHQRNNQTKYRALNINVKLTGEQRKVLERVFDLIVDQYDKTQAERFINTIAERF